MPRGGKKKVLQTLKDSAAHVVLVKLCLCFNLILVNVMIKGAFANKRGRRVPQTLKDSAECVANVAS